MLRLTWRVTLLAVVLVVSGSSARSQYGWVGGWGGWGGAGSTVAGSIAYGMGQLRRGAGAYNEQTAQARSVNAQTAMQVNDYMYAVNQRNAKNELIRMNRRRKRVNEAADATYKRLHDNPDSFDIHSGSALNVVLDELTNPEVYTQVVQKATEPIDSQLVKNIVFQHAPNMIAISLEDLSARGVPDALATDPAFEADRQAIRALVAKARQEAEGEVQVSIETLRRPGGHQGDAGQGRHDVSARDARPDQSDNFLKAFYGLTKMLERPNVDQFLEGLNKYPTTTLGHLITFMYSFNLRFGAAKTPVQEATYDQLYPILVRLRDESNAQGPNPLSAQVSEPDPKAVDRLLLRDGLRPPPTPAEAHVDRRPAPPPAQVSGMCDRGGCDPHVDISRDCTPSRIQEGSRILNVPVRPGRHPSSPGR